MDAALLRPLPYPNPNQLVLLFDVPLKRSNTLAGFAYREFTECREQNRVFSQMAGNAFHDLTLTGAGDPSIVNTAAVTPELFSLLNARPLTGRTLLPDDGKTGAAPVAIVSENPWRTRFGSNPTLIGQTITLDMKALRWLEFCRQAFAIPTEFPARTYGLRWRRTRCSDLAFRSPVRVQFLVGIIAMRWPSPRCGTGQRERASLL